MNKITSDPDQFVKNMDEWINITWGKVNNVIKGLTSELFLSIIAETPIDYGWTANSWYFSVDKPSDRTIPQYKRFKTKANERIVYGNRSSEKKQTTVMNSIKRSAPMTKKGVVKHKYYLTNNTPHIYDIEYNGWSGQRPQGMVRVNLDKMRNKEVRKYSTYKKGDEG